MAICSPVSFHRRAAGVAETAENHRDERTVHRLAHDVAEDRTRRADQRADHDQEVVGQRETDRRRRPARIRVEHRHHHRHVGATDAHDQVIADEERGQRHQDQRPGPGALEVEHQQDRRDQRRPGVQHVATGQLFRLAVDLAGQLAVGHHRAGEGHRTDEDAEEDLDLQHGDLGCGLVRHGGGKTRQRRQPFGIAGRLQAGHAHHLDMAVVTDEHRREADQRVHRRDQLRHLGHLHALRDDPADAAADGQHDQRGAPVAGARAQERGQNRQPHADDAVPDRALGAFLPRKAAQRLDEEDRRDDIGGRGETVFHEGPLLTISGTWRACAG